LKPDEYIREPFIWDDNEKDKLRTTWETPKYSTDATVRSLAKQKDDPMVPCIIIIKSFISYRNASKVLTYGGIETSPLSIRELVSLIRVYEGEQRLIIHNVSDVEITAKLESVNEFTTIDYKTHEGATVGRHRVVIPAYASVIMK
jgi:alpha-amylase